MKPVVLWAVVGAMAAAPNGASAALSAALSLTPAESVDLTAEGVTDWAYWGLAPQAKTTNLAADARKSDGESGAVGLIPDPVDLNGLAVGDPLFGCNGCESFTEQIGFNWSDGEGVATGLEESGALLFRRQSVGGGFSMSLPASAQTQRLNLYVSAFRSTGRLEANLSDNSGGYVDTSVTDPIAGFTDQLGVYSLEYSSSVEGTTLDLAFSMFEDFSSFESVGLLAATLAPVVEDPDPIAGDYNSDGAVDAADYTVWRDTLNQTGPALAADGDADQTIGPGDYDVWSMNYGAPEGMGAAVPEPSTGLLLAVWAVASVGRRRRFE